MMRECTLKPWRRKKAQTYPCPRRPIKPMKILTFFCCAEPLRCWAKQITSPALKFRTHTQNNEVGPFRSYLPRASEESKALEECLFTVVGTSRCDVRAAC